MFDFDDLGKKLTAFLDEIDKDTKAMNKWLSLSDEQRLHHIKVQNITKDRKVFQMVWSSMSECQKIEFMSGINFPINAVWKTNSFDIPVVVTGISGIHDGVVYYSIKGSSSSIPKDELYVS